MSQSEAIGALSLALAFDGKLMIFNVRCMHNTSARTITHRMCAPAEPRAPVPKQRWPFWPGLPWYPLSPFPCPDPSCTAFSLTHIHLASPAHKDLFICILTTVRRPLTNILGVSLGLCGVHMCALVAGARAVPCPSVLPRY